MTRLATLLLAESLVVAIVWMAGCTASDPSPSGDIFGDRPRQGGDDAGDSATRDAGDTGADRENGEGSADR